MRRFASATDLSDLPFNQGKPRGYLKERSGGGPLSEIRRARLSLPQGGGKDDVKPALLDLLEDQRACCRLQQVVGFAPEEVDLHHLDADVVLLLQSLQVELDIPFLLFPEKR